MTPYVGPRMLSYGAFQINGLVQPSGSCLTVGISSS